MLLIDVDHFKEVNDSYGHAAGDAILQAVARRLVTLAGPHDTVARLGGDEFALLAAGPLDGRHAAELGHRLVDRITQPIEHDGGRMHVSVSVGVAHAVERSLLTRNADVALYAAKRAGRSRSVLFDAARHEALAHRVELRDRLASAVAANRLEVAYQPIMHLGSGRIRGFEALVRWTDEVLGPVRPDVFIALAEDSGLIGDLGRAVLAKACRQLAVWRDRFPALDLQMSVNLSPRQLEDEQLVDHVRAILRDNHLDASSLTLEVTESAFTAQDRGVEALNRLHAIGVGLALDDFGSSESSLARLHELPVTALKIDRSFLTQLAVAPERTRRLIEAVVAIAAALELPTVAEGIETTDQWAAVEGAGCDYGQGFIIARPMDLDAAEAFLSLAEVDRSDGPLHALFD